MAKGKRANGEGSIRKRKDGRWEGRYTVGHDPETGKCIYKNVLGKTQGEVKEKLKAAIEQARALDVSRANGFTLCQWLQYWLDNYGSVYLRPSSMTNYTGFLNNQIKNDEIGSMKLRDLTMHDVQFFFNRMRTAGRVQRKESEKKPAGLSAKTIRNMYFFISHALDRAVREKLIVSNPTDDCILPKKEKVEMKTLPLEDLSKFFEEAKRSGVFELYFTDLATGLRRGELLGLKWTDIDLTLIADNGQQMWADKGIRHYVNDVYVPANQYVAYTCYIQNPDIPEYHGKYRHRWHSNTHWEKAAG